ncbi:MAG: SEC-C domain-containing protein [Pirellulales bacterium]|nr:SEC-C domain-containing protein [Pirellulales bacterium]
MGAIAGRFVEYTSPLIEATDGSKKQLERAFSIGQICWSLALLPETKRAEFLATIEQALGLEGDELVEFRQKVIEPMIQRHEDMFPGLHRSRSTSRFAAIPRRVDPQPETRRNALRPCGSGRKYKHCCGRR